MNWAEANSKLAAHEETWRRSAEMQLKLTKVNSKLAETLDLLKSSRATNNCLAEECNQLKLAVIQQK